MPGVFDIEAAEEEIKAKLASLEPVFEVITIPQSQSAYKEAMQKTLIDIAYGGTKFRESEGMGNIIQRGERLFSILIQGRRLRGAGGCYAALTAIPELLIGFEPTLCSKMYLKEEGPMERDSDMFKFAQVYATTSMIQENVPDEEAADLNEFTFERR